MLIKAASAQNTNGTLELQETAIREAAEKSGDPKIKVIENLKKIIIKITI